MDEPIDLLVVGGGTAGLVGAQTAAALGARTLLVEQARTGGDCLWTGCVPSKTLRTIAAAARADRFRAGAPTDYAAVRARVAAAVAAIEPVDSPDALRRARVQVRAGSARFTGPGTVEIDGVPVRYRQALLAMGAEPVIPPVPGLPDTPHVTSETIWDLTELPDRLVVLGAGPVGCELGQAFARLGSTVTLVSPVPVLAAEDRDAAELIAAALRSDGVTIRTGVAATRVSEADGAIRVHLDDGSRLAADVLLVAAGRRPRTFGMGLERVGVDVDADGSVLVDRTLRTSDPRIWAAGDVTGPPYYTHRAGMHASIAAANAVLGLRRRISPVLPRVTFTDPELAAVGLTRPRRTGHSVVTEQHDRIDRAITDGATAGFTRLVLGRGDRILGGTVVSPRAGETLGELTLAVARRLNAGDLATVTHAYPTYSDGLWNATVARYRSGLAAPPLSGALSLLRAVRAGLLDLRRRG